MHKNIFLSASVSGSVEGEPWMLPISESAWAVLFCSSWIFSSLEEATVGTSGKNRDEDKIDSVVSLILAIFEKLVVDGRPSLGLILSFIETAACLNNFFGGSENIAGKVKGSLTRCTCSNPEVANEGRGSTFLCQGSVMDQFLQRKGRKERAL